MGETIGEKGEYYDAKPLTAGVCVKAKGPKRSELRAQALHVTGGEKPGGPA